MPSKKKKYNARFPAGRIKKIMQTDKEVGKVAQAVPVIISRTLELFVESLLTKSIQITQMRNAKTLTPYHMKQCILSESRFDFLKDLVKYIPDVSTQEENESNSLEASDFNSMNEDEEEPEKQEVKMNPNPTGQGTSAGRTPVIQYMPKLTKQECNQDQSFVAPVPIPSLVPIERQDVSATPKPVSVVEETKLPPLVPFANNNGQNSSDMLLIDEDYDN